MSDQLSNERVLSRYLLGQVSEEERAHIEEQFLRDGEYYEQLLIVEDDLRCAYARGSLSPAEREQFEKRFLIFPDERQRVELARAMIGELTGMEGQEKAARMTTPLEKRSRWEQLLGIFTFSSPAMRVATAMAAVVVLIAFAWLLFETSRLRRQLSSLEAQRTAREQEIERQSAAERASLNQISKELEDERKQRAQLERQLATQYGQTSGSDRVRDAVLSLFLSPGLVRGGGETKRVTIKQDSTEIRLLLNLGEKTRYRSYRASLLDSNARQIWSRSGLRAQGNQGSQVVVLSIPARRLAEDDYEIDLRGLTKDGELERAGDYYFTVLKK